MDINLHKDHPSIEGNWWNPLEPQIRWHGTLILKAGETAKVRVVQYGESFLQSKAVTEPVMVIHGMSKDGKAITLSRCFCLSSSRTFGSEELTFDVQEVIFGAHLLADDLVFSEIQAEFDYLNEWVTYCRFQEREMDDERGQKEIRLRLNQDHEFPFTAPGYAKAQFYVGYHSSSQAFKFSIESRSNLNITYSENRTLSEIIKDLREWKWFLTLATRNETNIRRLTVFHDNHSIDLGKDIVKFSLDVWISSPQKESQVKTLREDDMNFALPDIRANLSEIVSKWKEMQILWAPTLHRFFASIHRKGLQLPEEFLFQAQALEALYWTRSKNNKVTSREAFIDAWERAPDALKAKLGTKEEFVSLVSINRNYLTHYRPDDEDKIAGFSELFDLSQKLKFILEVAILKEMGIPDNLVDKVFGVGRWGRLVNYA